MVALVNVTELPGQNGFADGDIVTVTGKFPLTIIEIKLLKTGLLETQVRLEFKIQSTWSPFTGT